MGRHRYRDGIRAISHKKGRKSEEIAAAHLRNVGFEDVKLNENLKGPDITAHSPYGRLKIEVKSAVRYLSHGKYEFWLTEKLTEPRKNDDVVAIVTPQKTVHLYTMRAHLIACRKDGRRNVTQIVKEAS